MTKESKAMQTSLLKQAVHELGIDVPVMATRMIGNKLELHLYGGAKVIWPASAGKLAESEAEGIAAVAGDPSREESPAGPPAKAKARTRKTKK